jgi:hypothetical protein
MRYFLLVFDRRRGHLLGDPLECPDNQSAMRARFKREASASAAGEELEVVVLGAASREALENTHSRYFGSGRELSLT